MMRKVGLVFLEAGQMKFRAWRENYCVINDNKASYDHFINQIRQGELLHVGGPLAHADSLILLDATSVNVSLLSQE